VTLHGSLLRRGHPRVDGGNLEILAPSITSPGPSPRVRGKLLTELISTSLSGTIPACTGETSSSSTVSFYPRDHPRVYGGNRSCSRAFQSTLGPSPRVRGKPKPTRTPTTT